MFSVDSALLDLTEWLCRRFQVLTGRTNVWLAFQLTNFSIVVFFVWAGMHLRIGGRPFRIGANKGFRQHRGNALKQKGLCRSDTRVGMESSLNSMLSQNIVKRQQRHTLVMRHICKDHDARERVFLF